MVLKTTFGWSQKWFHIRGTLGVGNEERIYLGPANKGLRGGMVLILGGLNSRIGLYKRKLQSYHFNVCVMNNLENCT